MTTLPKVTVTRIGTHLGWRITCTCGLVVFRIHRADADWVAGVHRRSHARPEPQDAA